MGKRLYSSNLRQRRPIAKNHIALQRGSITLAQDNRLGYNVDEPVGIKVNPDGYVDVTLNETKAPYENIVYANIPLENGNFITATDYSSAGKLWTEESKMAIWMLNK